MLLLVAAPQLLQAQSNDGFRRLDGTMYLVRNGEARPMSRDIHLPNGRTITRDGFIVERDGKRTELADGRGCTLLGQSTAVTTQANGQLALAAPGVRESSTDVTEATLISQFQRWWGGPGRGKGKGHYKKGKNKRKHDDD